jgi:hypothetical protein
MLYDEVWYRCISSTITFRGIPEKPDMVITGKLYQGIIAQLRVDCMRSHDQGETSARVRYTTYTLSAIKPLS